MCRNIVITAVALALLLPVLATAQADPREGPIRDMMQRHFDAMKKEDVDAVKATIHPLSPVFANTESTLRQLFQTYDLGYQWRILKIEFRGEALAYVEIEQTTRKISGPAFRDNRIRSRSELRKYEGDWKLFNTTIEDVQYLN